jgi:hypothetical protein
LREFTSRLFHQLLELRAFRGQAALFISRYQSNVSQMSEPLRGSHSVHH